MIVFNLTLVGLVEVEKEIISEIKENFIPSLKNSGHGQSYKIMRVLSGEGNESTFALQVSFENQQAYIKFETEYMDHILAEIQKKFPNKVMPFATLLEEL